MLAIPNFTAYSIAVAIALATLLRWIPPQIYGFTNHRLATLLRMMW